MLCQDTLDSLFNLSLGLSSRLLPGCRYPSTGPQNGWKVIKANGPSKLTTFMLTLKNWSCQIMFVYSFICYKYLLFMSACVTICLFKYVQYKRWGWGGGNEKSFLIMSCRKSLVFHLKKSEIRIQNIVPKINLLWRLFLGNFLGLNF